MPDRYAVFGHPVAHSKSPRIHGLFAAQTGQDITYEALLAPLDDFAGAVRAFVAGGGRGANVTVPFKEQAHRLANRLTPRAHAAGAVNTLCFAPDGILGDNTDGAGLLRDLTVNLGVEIKGRRVLLLGAGGAARGVVGPLLAAHPRALLIANRTAARARALAAASPGATGSGFDALADAGAFDVIVNATSAGLDDQALPLPDGLLAPGALSYDMVYGRQTPFMTWAQAQGGGRVADGLGMLVEQAAEAFALWRGVRPDTVPVIAALRQPS